MAQRAVRDWLLDVSSFGGDLDTQAGMNQAGEEIIDKKRREVVTFDLLTPRKRFWLKLFK